MLSYIANLASILGLVVSVIAWFQVARLRRRFVGELRLTDVLARARHELVEAGRHLRSRSGLAITEGSGALKKAVIHVRALRKLANLETDNRIEQIRVRVVTNEGDPEPSTRVIEEARTDLEVLVVEVENVLEEMKRK